MWKIEYDNDTGPLDEGYYEWWIVTNEKMSYKCNSKNEATWLCALLNANESSEELKPCPFCGRRNNVELYTEDEGDPGYVSWCEVRCLGCDIEGPLGQNAEEAIRRWNKRDT